MSEPSIEWRFLWMSLFITFRRHSFPCNIRKPPRRGPGIDGVYWEAWTTHLAFTERCYRASNWASAGININAKTPFRGDALLVNSDAQKREPLGIVDVNICLVKSTWAMEISRRCRRELVGVVRGFFTYNITAPSSKHLSLSRTLHAFAI